MSLLGWGNRTNNASLLSGTYGMREDWLILGLTGSRRRWANWFYFCATSLCSALRWPDKAGNKVLLRAARLSESAIVLTLFHRKPMKRPAFSRLAELRAKNEKGGIRLGHCFTARLCSFYPISRAGQLFIIRLIPQSSSYWAPQLIHCGLVRSRHFPQPIYQKGGVFPCWSVFPELFFEEQMPSSPISGTFWTSPIFFLDWPHHWLRHSKWMNSSNNRRISKISSKPPLREGYHIHRIESKHLLFSDYLSNKESHRNCYQPRPVFRVAYWSIEPIMNRSSPQ